MCKQAFRESEMEYQHFIDRDTLNEVFRRRI